MAKTKPKVVKLGGNFKMDAGINSQPKEGLGRRLWRAILEAIGISRH